MKRYFQFPIRPVSIALLLGLMVGVVVTLLTPMRFLPLIEPTVKDVDAEVIYEMMQKDPEAYIFVDVRSTEAFESLHAETSTSMPLHTFYDERHELPKKGKTIVLICSGGRASGVAYSYLEHFGFRNMVRVEGGIEAWTAAGLPANGTAATRLP